MKKIFTIIILLSLIGLSNGYSQHILLSENFESDILNPMITVQTVGTFNSYPGIKSNTNFGSTKAFGFGLSTCPANCFSNYTSMLTITFPSPTFVDSIKWSEMELFGNWGSQGEIHLDGNVLSGSSMGALPVNSGIPDAFPRYQAYGINQTVTTIAFYMTDITNTSEVTIDDLEITRDTNCLNMPTVSISGLNASYTTSDAAVTMTGTPTGGNFYGVGVIGNTFNPSVAGVGTHTIVYVYDNGACNKATCESVDVTANKVLEIQKQTNKVSIIPNPNNGKFNISFDINKPENFTIRVFNALGRTVYSETKNKYQGNYNNLVDLSKMSNGIYTVSVKIGETITTEKISIAK